MVVFSNTMNLPVTLMTLAKHTLYTSYHFSLSRSNLYTWVALPYVCVHCEADVAVFDFRTRNTRWYHSWIRIMELEDPVWERSPIYIGEQIWRTKVKRCDDTFWRIVIIMVERIRRYRLQDRQFVERLAWGSWWRTGLMIILKTVEPI